METFPVIGVVETPSTGVDGGSSASRYQLLGQLILALIALPMAIIAAAIKLTSRGRSSSSGADTASTESGIDVLKFRSMNVCENGAEVRQACAETAASRRWAASCGATSVDELPQFINVITGEMSIVGPGPHAVGAQRSSTGSPDRRL